MATGAASDEWIEVDPNTLDLPAEEREVEGDVHISLFMSPYDVPEAVRGYWDEDEGRFIIEFRYLDNEPWKRAPGDGVVRLRLGKHSRRICGIEVDVQRVEADSVSLTISAALSALEKLAQRPSESKPNENYKLARELVALMGSRLFPPALGATEAYAQ